MKFLPRKILLSVALGLAVLGGLAVVRIVATKAPWGSQAAAVYYCPMHPTYTSNRPGDCPICNMKLVKKEAQALKEICTLHNCPKLHEGRPCPMLVVSKPGEAVTCPICGTHVVETEGSAPRKVLYWTDPMIPGYRSERSGKSPMGMDLIPVYEEVSPSPATGGSPPEGYAPILLAPQKRQLIGVRTARAERRSLTKTIRTAGRIAYDPELYQAEEEYLQAVGALKKATSQGSSEVVEQAERLVAAARTRLQILGLSPTLIEEMIHGQGPDKRLLLADAEGRVWLYASIYEYELPWVREGQTILVESPTASGKRWEGTIRSIDSILDPTTRSARVRALLTDPEGTLKPEMYVNASLVVPIGEVLAVPQEAVFDTGSRQIVFVEKGNGLFEPRDLLMGAKADDFVEVKSGIQEGESVVVSGNFLIDSESRLKSALQGHSHGQ